MNAKQKAVVNMVVGATGMAVTSPLMIVGGVIGMVTFGMPVACCLAIFDEKEKHPLLTGLGMTGGVGVVFGSLGFLPLFERGRKAYKKSKGN